MWCLFLVYTYYTLHTPLEGKIRTYTSTYGNVWKWFIDVALDGFLKGAYNEIIGFNGILTRDGGRLQDENTSKWNGLYLQCTPR